MKLKGFFILLALAGCGLMATAVGQQAPPNIGPLAFSFNGASGTFVVNGISGQSFCAVTVPSTATMGGGTITMKVTSDNGANYFAVTGLPDLGAGGSSSQTITSAGTQLTAPVSGKTGFEVVLSGATAAAITGTITCGFGSGVIGSSGGSGSSNTTIVAPTDGSGNVKVISENSPLPVITPGGFPGFTIADPNGVSFPAITPTATPAAAAPMIPVIAVIEGQCGTAGLLCPISAAGQAATGSARNPLNVVSCNNTAATCQVIIGTGADATANTSMGAENVSSFHYIFNGTTWDRLRSQPGTTGYQGVLSNIPTAETQANGTSGTCTNIKAAATTLLNVMYASGSAQTGTLTIYNEATAACTAADTIYVSATHAATGTADLPLISASAGLTYKWTTAAEVGIVLIGSNP
jgi:hypothetical protein